MMEGGFFFARLLCRDRVAAVRVFPRIPESFFLDGEHNPRPKVLIMADPVHDPVFGVPVIRLTKRESLESDNQRSTFPDRRRHQRRCAAVLLKGYLKAPLPQVSTLSRSTGLPRSSNSSGTSLPRFRGSSSEAERRALRLQVVGSSPTSSSQRRLRWVETDFETLMPRRIGSDDWLLT